MALYSKQQLAHERSIGLQLSDEDNENFYIDPTPSQNVQAWSNEQFESWLATKQWHADIKDMHRKQFKGYISFNSDGSFSYDSY